jgi:cytochrome c553
MQLTISRTWKRIFLGTALVAVLLAVLIPLFVYLASEAIIQRRYPLASTTAHAEKTSKQILRGEHLVAIAGCADCHGAQFQGRLLHADTPLPVYAGNLSRAAHAMSDDELERAIRYAISPDATTMWFMPSGNYTYMSEDDVGSIISYLRTLSPAGAVRPAPVFNTAARIAILNGTLRPAVLETLDSPSSIDLGPRYDGGRYLARISCGECHGSDLKGQGYAPDLSRISLYDRPAFFSLLREGYGAKGRVLPAMYRLARIRFHGFADYEIMALYDYLDARAHAPADLVARSEALRRHQEDEKRLLETGQ